MAPTRKAPERGAFLRQLTSSASGLCADVADGVHAVLVHGVVHAGEGLHHLGELLDFELQLFHLGRLGGLAFASSAAAAACAACAACAARATCDPPAATCDGIPPSCPPGTTPGIVGECFNGLCVPLDLCDVVPDCEVCGPDQICLRLERLQGPAYTCRPRPSWCGETVDCACAASLCGPTYPLCEDLAPGQLSCSCEDC